MLKLLLDTLNACTLLLAWGLSGLTLFVFFWQAGRGKGWSVVPAGKKVLFILSLCVVIALNLCFTSPVPDILLNVWVILSSGYLFHRSFFYRLIRRKAGACLFRFFLNRLSDRPLSRLRANSEEKGVGVATLDVDVMETSTMLPEEKIKAIHRLLDSPGYLCKPDLSLPLLAKDAAINCTYLSRYFNRQLGMSFPEYITVRRLDMAEKLLRNTDMKVVDILEQSGFQNPSVFYQAFNERHQLSPLQWRKLVKQDGPGIVKLTNLFGNRQLS